jgi:DNA-binding IclR family transcriptional regulator
LQSRARY